MSQRLLDDAIDELMDELMDEPAAYVLYSMFVRSHRSFFATDREVLPDAIVPDWPPGTLERAVEVLLERGYISEINDPWGQPARIYRHRGALDASGLNVVQGRGKDWWVIERNSGMVYAICDSNAAAWRWIDRNTGAGQADTGRHYRIRNSERFS